MPVPFFHCLFQGDGDLGRFNELIATFRSPEDQARLASLLNEQNKAIDKNENILGNTPFHDAAIQGHTEAFAAIKKWGGDINGRNNLGDTPLLSLIKSDRGNYRRHIRDEVYALLEEGADWRITNKENKNAREVAEDMLEELWAQLKSDWKKNEERAKAQGGTFTPIGGTPEVIVDMQLLVNDLRKMQIEEDRNKNTPEPAAPAAEPPPDLKSFYEDGVAANGESAGARPVAARRERSAGRS